MLLEAAAFHNLGLTYYSQREYARALASALKAAKLFRQWQDMANWAAALRNAAWVCCAIGDATRAGQLLAEIERTHTDEEGRWHQQVGRAYLALIEGQLEWCIELAYSVARDAEGDVQVQGAWLVGHAYLRQGDLGRAREWADMAERAARVLADTRSLKDAGDLLRAIEAAEQRGA